MLPNQVCLKLVFNFSKGNNILLKKMREVEEKISIYK